MFAGVAAPPQQTSNSLKPHQSPGIIDRMSDLQKRLVTPEARPDENADPALRPVKLADFIGQDQLKENLMILISAARQKSGK